MAYSIISDGTTTYIYNDGTLAYTFLNSDTRASISGHTITITDGSQTFTCVDELISKVETGIQRENSIFNALNDLLNKSNYNPLGGSAPQTLTDGATINWNIAKSGNAVVTLGGNRTIANPTNTVNGENYTLEIIQDATGSRTITWGSNFVWAAGTAPTLTTTATKRDFIEFTCRNGKLYGTNVIKAFA